MNKLNLKTLKRGDTIRIRYKDGPWDEFTFGGGAYGGAYGGFVYWFLYNVSGYLYRSIGARVDDETGAVYADRGWEVELVKAA